MPSPKMTIPTQLVLRALLTAGTELYGLQIIKATGLAGGAVYPLLARLERFGWLQSRWENINQIAEGRPRRCYYQFTPDGEARASTALARARVHVTLTLQAAPRV